MVEGEGDGDGEGEVVDVVDVVEAIERRRLPVEGMVAGEGEWSSESMAKKKKDKKE